MLVQKTIIAPYHRPSLFIGGSTCFAFLAKCAHMANDIFTLSTKVVLTQPQMDLLVWARFQPWCQLASTARCPYICPRFQLFAQAMDVKFAWKKTPFPTGHGRFARGVSLRLCFNVCLAERQLGRANAPVHTAISGLCSLFFVQKSINYINDFYTAFT